MGVEGLTRRESCLRAYRTVTRESLACQVFGAGHVHGAPCTVPRARRPLDQVVPSDLSRNLALFVQCLR